MLATLARQGDLGAFQAARELVLGTLAILEGDLVTARDHLRAAHAPGLLTWLVRLNLMRVTAALGDRTEARALFAELDEQVAGTDLNSALAMLDIDRALLARETSPAEADSAAHAALSRAVEFGFVTIQVDALELLAVLAGDAGGLAEAGRLLGAAEAFRARTGYYPFRARTGYYRTLPGGPLDELRGKLDPASLEEGSRLSLEEAIEYARRGRGERGRPDHGWESLTPTESRVVELVAAGLPNKDIAQKLFVSLATVKTHLVHVYTKLDVRTRAELAAAATRRAAATPPARTPGSAGGGSATSTSR
jgi:DNA-binding CsgD family transcriptional regulator